MIVINRRIDKISNLLHRNKKKMEKQFIWKRDLFPFFYSELSNQQNLYRNVFSVWYITKYLSEIASYQVIQGNANYGFTAVQMMLIIISRY